MIWLEDAASSIDHLEGVVITQLPDCSAWGFWSRATWDAVEIAAYFGDMSRANRNALKTVGALDTSVRLTIEAEQKLILIEELTPSFIAVLIFEKKIPLGMARLRMRKIGVIIRENLPSNKLVERSRAERIMEFLQRYAPDAHALPMRLSLQTGISPASLNEPSELSSEETARLEIAARNILGVQQLRI